MSQGEEGSKGKDADIEDHRAGVGGAGGVGGEGGGTGGTGGTGGNINYILPIKKLFFILFMIGSLNSAILFGIVALEWYTYSAQTNELAIERESEIREEARDERIQRIILNHTNEIIDNQDINGNLTREAVNLLLQGAERANVRGNVTIEFQNQLLQNINDTLAIELQRSANLTAEETQEVIDDIRIVFNTTIPELNESLTELSGLVRNTDNKLNELFYNQPANDTIRSDVFANITRNLNSSIQ